MQHGDGGYLPNNTLSPPKERQAKQIFRKLPEDVLNKEDMLNKKHVLNKEDVSSSYK